MSKDTEIITETDEHGNVVKATIVPKSKKSSKKTSEVEKTS